jgi:DNA-binding SARP family transcriptional activator/tetratricopeptide (TPR) repeat protein
MEATACSKLSTVYNNYGDVAESARLAEEGLALAPTDAYATRIRLRGNLAVTVKFFESLDTAIRECKRVAIESTERGYEQFAAIAHHNIGAMLRDAGRLDESIANLTRSARYWDASPTNPFADSSERVLTLLAMGRDAEAAPVANSAVQRTQPWKRANSEARFGVAAVQAYQGRFDEAIDLLRELADEGDLLGSSYERVLALLVECLYLTGASVDDLRLVGQKLAASNPDPRLEPLAAVAKALIAHRAGACEGACDQAYRVLAAWRSIGANYIADTGELPLAILAIDHDVQNGLREIDRVMTAATIRPAARWWLRRIAPVASQSFGVVGGPRLMTRLLEMDSDFWMAHAASSLSLLSEVPRRELLTTIAAQAGPDTSEHLRGVDGADVQEVRRALVRQHAPRIYLSSFGSLAIRHGGWSGPSSVIGRRRIRLLLGLLIAHFEGGLTRDQTIDILWPEADPAAAVNSLNQSVFQLRRLIDPGYREGDSAQYVISNVDAVQLHTDLVVTDLAEIRRLRTELAEPNDAASRATLIHQIVDLVRGEFLADLKYEDWVGRAQMSVHSEVRSILLPIARGEMLEGADEWAFRAGCSLAALDPYDEDAHVAMIRHLSASGRRSQARTLATGFADRLRADLDEEPSDELALAARIVGASV